MTVVRLRSHVDFSPVDRNLVLGWDEGVRRGEIVIILDRTHAEEFHYDIVIMDSKGRMFYRNMHVQHINNSFREL